MILWQGVGNLTLATIQIVASKFIYLLKSKKRKKKYFSSLT